MVVIKRHGAEVEYDRNKIVSAVYKAAKECTSEQGAKVIADTTASEVETSLRMWNIQKADVEEIQDAVENALMSLGEYDVARRYICYRYEHKKNREWKSQMMISMAEKLAAKNNEMQNANVDENSFGGRRG